MEHLLLKAAVTAATDKGTFEAVISAASIDRERDIVDPAGMVRALHKWVPLGKKIPLAWNHSTRPEDQIGYVDPGSARVQGNEVVASGKIDLDTDNGQHAWRCVKAGTLGFSFGYLVPQGGSTKRAGGGRHIKELDVFEVTATPTPMNGDTRVLDYKAIKGHADVGPHARDKLKYLIRYYMGKPHPFTECTHDNAKRFGPEGADKVCATLKDVGLGTTHWRNQHGKAVPSTLHLDDPVVDEPTDSDYEDMCQALLDAAGGNLDGLLAMWVDHMHNNGDGPTAPGKALDPDELRAEADKVSREFSLRGARKQTDGEDDDATESPAQAVRDAIEELQEFIDGERQEGDQEDVNQAHRLLVGLQQLLQREQTQEPDEATDDAPAKAVEPVESTAKAVRDQVNEIMRHMGKTDAASRAIVDLETLRGEHAEQTELLEKATTDPEAAKKQLAERTADVDTLKRAGDAVTLSAVKNHRRNGKREPNQSDVPEGAEWIVPEGELEGARNGSLKAVWTAAYVSDLPDSSFLYVEPGGSKDSDGKTTPRSLRHFPYKDASGAVDQPHLRNALARIPQSNLPADVKDKLTTRAQNLLDNQKALVVDPDVAVDVTDRGYQTRSVDPLVQQAKAIAVGWRGHGVSRPKPPPEPEPPRPEYDETVLRREMYALIGNALSGNRSTTNNGT